LYLAREGYPNPPNLSTVFHPLLPWTIRAATPVLRSPTAAAIVVVALAGLAFCILYHRVARHVLDEPNATRALVLTLCFPTAFFLSVPYTEALFLALLFGFVWGYRYDHRLWGLPFAFLLPLTRPQGLLIGGVCLLDAAVAAMRADERAKGRQLRALAHAGAFAAGIGAFLVFHGLASGSWRAWLEAQRMFIAQNSISRLLDPTVLLRYLVGKPSDLYGYVGAGVDQAFAVLMLACTVLVWRLRDRFLFLLYLALILPPAAQGTGNSYARYALLGAPFVALGFLKTWPHRDGWLVAVAAAFIVIQVIFTARFAIDMWVS
jgi:hypothetical protein